MTQDDFNPLPKAAEKRWPDAVMTNSGIVLGLARIAALQVLGKRVLKFKEDAPVDITVEAGTNARKPRTDEKGQTL